MPGLNEDSVGNVAKEKPKEKAKVVVVQKDKEKGKADLRSAVGDLERKDPRDHKFVRADTPTIKKGAEFSLAKFLITRTTCSSNATSVTTGPLLANQCRHTS